MIVDLPHILMFVVLQGYNLRPALTTQEFNSIETCQVAAAHVTRVVDKLLLVQCVKK